MVATATDAESGPVPLTDAQEKVLRAIVGYMAEHGRSPAIRELGRLIGTSNPNGVMCHLRALEAKRRVKLVANGTARGIVVPTVEAATRAAAVRLLAAGLDADAARAG